MKIAKSLTATSILVLLVFSVGCSLSVSEAELTVFNEVGIDIDVAIDGDWNVISVGESKKRTIEWDGFADYDVKIEACQLIPNRTECQPLKKITLRDGDTVEYTIYR